MVSKNSSTREKVMKGAGQLLSGLTTVVTLIARPLRSEKPKACSNNPVDITYLDVDRSTL